MLNGAIRLAIQATSQFDIVVCMSSAVPATMHVDTMHVAAMHAATMHVVDCGLHE